MTVRAWVIVGQGDIAYTLPVANSGGWAPVIPQASEYDPGDWIVWQPGLHPETALTLVCVDIQLGEAVNA